jgi:hypothetical protein
MKDKLLHYVYFDTNVDDTFSEARTLRYSSLKIISTPEYYLVLI